MILNAIVNGTRITAIFSHCIPTSILHIVSEDAVQWTVDGEDGGLRKSVTMMNHNKALPILCSKEIIHALSEEYASE